MFALEGPLVLVGRSFGFSGVGFCTPLGCLSVKFCGPRVMDGGLYESVGRTHRFFAISAAKATGSTSLTDCREVDLTDEGLESSFFWSCSKRSSMRFSNRAIELGGLLVGSLPTFSFSGGISSKYGVCLCDLLTCGCVPCLGCTGVKAETPLPAVCTDGVRSPSK